MWHSNLATYKCFEQKACKGINRVCNCQSFSPSGKVTEHTTKEESQKARRESVKVEWVERSNLQVIGSNTHMHDSHLRTKAYVPWEGRDNRWKRLNMILKEGVLKLYNVGIRNNFLYIRQRTKKRSTEWCSTFSPATKASS